MVFEAVTGEVVEPSVATRFYPGLAAARGTLVWATRRRPTRNELIAYGRTEEEVCREITADALVYQDVDALKRSISDVNPSLKSFEASCFDGIYVTWSEPAEGVLSALRAAGDTRTKVVTLDLSEPVGLDMVKGGNVVAIAADKAYELGRAMADAAGYGLLGKQAPPFVVAPVLTVTKANVVEGWQDSLHRAPPQSILDAAK